MESRCRGRERVRAPPPHRAFRAGVGDAAETTGSNRCAPTVDVPPRRVGSRRGPRRVDAPRMAATPSRNPPPSASPRPGGRRGIRGARDRYTHHRSPGPGSAYATAEEKGTSAELDASAAAPRGIGHRAVRHRAQDRGGVGLPPPMPPRVDVRVEVQGRRRARRRPRLSAPPPAPPVSARGRPRCRPPRQRLPGSPRRTRRGRRGRGRRAPSPARGSRSPRAPGCGGGG